MMLLDQLERAMNAENSYFRAQLLREDLARLGALRRLAGKTTSEEAFLTSGLRLEWTPERRSNQLLMGTLEPLLKAFYAAEKSGPGADADLHLIEAWGAFDAQRMDVLVGCLSRVPKPKFD